MTNLIIRSDDYTLFELELNLFDQIQESLTVRSRH